ncbi:MAG: class I SAM-dependent methyltransferase [Reyranellaceae bacterium]
MCSRCHSQSRTRLIHSYLKVKLRERTSVDILHIAPEISLAKWLRDRWPTGYVAADIAPERYSHTGSVLSANLESTPFCAQAFDIVICSHVLEHVSDDRAALREIHRVLRADGLALLLVPEATDGRAIDEDIDASIGERCRRFGQDDHLRLYSREGFLTRLDEAGFNVESVRAADFGVDTATRFRINPLEYIRVCSKKVTLVK